MPRKPRVEYPGAFYHVICRGNNRESVLTEEEKPVYIQIIRKYKGRYKFKIYAYCIMDNHVHLLIETGDISLSKIMQGIQQSFTQYYNKKYNRIGHVFQQRYKALLCDKERYLLQLIKYIHYNPVKAGIRQGLDYKWSSHNCYISGTDDSLVEIEFILSMFSENSTAAQNQYRYFMNVEFDTTPIEAYSVVPKMENGPKSILTKRRYRENEIDIIIDEVCKEADISLEDVLRRSKIQKYSDARKAIVRLSDKYFVVSNKELAEKLNIPSSMVSKIKSGECRGTQLVDEIINKVEEKGIFQA